MKDMFRFLLAIVVGLVIALPKIATAQEGEWTCSDDLLAAAQATYDEASGLEDQAQVDKLIEAYGLAAQGEALCVNDLDRFRAAQELRRNTRSLLYNMKELPLDPGVVELGDFGLSLVCRGEGSPTVIFENGYGSSASSTWRDIQPAISMVTRTCRYDRWNLGSSMRSAWLDDDAVRTTQDQVDDLVLLLETAEIDPPYILVAWSRGGWNALLFADQDPALVVGLVLIEAPHPDSDRRLCEVIPPDECPLNLQPTDPNNIEHLDFVDSGRQVAEIDSLGDRPLVVITAGRGFDEPMGGIWNELQADLVTFSTNSRHIILENSRHQFHMGSELNLVLDAIIWVIDEVRAADE